MSDILLVGGCIECGGILTGRQKKYCGSSCSKRFARAVWVFKVYGITLEEYDHILDHQGGVCAICNRPPKVNEVFHVDHEHSKAGAGRVRGIVCSYCNTRLIGRLRDHEKAQRLADYLRQPPATEALGREVLAPGRPKKKRQPRKKART